MEMYTLSYFQNRITAVRAGVRKIQFRIGRFGQFKVYIESDALALLGPYGSRWEALMESCDVFSTQYQVPLDKIERSCRELNACYQMIARYSEHEAIGMRLLMDEYIDTLITLQEQIIIELDERMAHIREGMRMLAHICDSDDDM